MESRVAITKCETYEDATIRGAVLDSLDAIGGLDRIIKPGDKVLLKVNLLAPAGPEAAVTTHPALVKPVIEAVKAAGGLPLVADAPGYLYVGGKSKALIESGVKAAAEEAGAEAMQFESVENPFIETEVPGGVWMKKILAARLALEADVIITLPKLKTHSGTWYSGAIKNMFGAVATKTRKEAHMLALCERLSGAIVDIYSALKPELAVMDAVVGMEGEGPRHGAPRQTGLIMASYDGVALDAVAAGVIGFKPGEILTTKLAHERGLGEGDLSNIEVVGESLDDVAVEYAKPSGRQINIHPLLMRLAHRLLKTEPQVLKKICTRCSICAQSCPVDAISMDPYPEINRQDCIECYCCNEMCPEGAMQMKKSWLARRVSE